jgi:hypothetical protein
MVTLNVYGIGAGSSTNSNLDCVYFTIGTATADSTTQIPANALITECRVNVTSAYDGGATIEVGYTGTPNAIMTTAGNTPAAVGIYKKDQLTDWSGANIEVKATVGGVPTVGAAKIFVLYVITPNP